MTQSRRSRLARVIPKADFRSLELDLPPIGSPFVCSRASRRPLPIFPRGRRKQLIPPLEYGDDGNEIPRVPSKKSIMHKRLSLLLRSALTPCAADSHPSPRHRLVSRGRGRNSIVHRRTRPGSQRLIPEILFPSHQDPQVALTILAGIAGSIMTVVSIIFAILLMTLTLASTQFSPRILVNFVRDHSTQWTLGIFLGTFCFCMAALPAVRSRPHPFVPVATVMTAMLLALLCVGWLIFFINHISQSISVNHIVDRSHVRRNSSSTSSCRTRAARQNFLNTLLPFARHGNGSSSVGDLDTSDSSSLLSCRSRKNLWRADHFGETGWSLHSRWRSDLAGLGVWPRDAGTRG